MGGIFGGGKSSPAPAPEPKKPVEQPKPEVRAEAEESAARRRARRGGRALLSDTRLNPEAGVQTLGSGPMV